MGLPDGSFAIAVFVVVALPGLIYAAVRRWARGETPEDRDLSLSIARGAVFATALTSFYLLVFGDGLLGGLVAGTDDTVSIVDARKVALTVLVLYLALPAVITLVFHLPHIEWQSTTQLKRLRLPRSKHGYTSTPSAWDHVLRQNQPAWVKIRRANGEWVGGWFTKGSFASAYPEPRSIYIEHQWIMTDDGNYEAPISDTGVHLTIGNEDMVIWTKPSPQISLEGDSL